MSSYRCVQRVGRAESQTPPPSVRSSGSSRLPLIHHAPLCSCVAELARSRIAKARGNHACQLVCRVSDAQGLCPMHNCAESLRQAAQRRSGRQAGRQCHGDRVTAAHWRACRRRLQWSHAPCRSTSGWRVHQQGAWALHVRIRAVAAAWSRSRFPLKGHGRGAGCRLTVASRSRSHRRDDAPARAC